jgi:hypothetical protein
MNVLIAGWFSFEGMGATVGDLLCRDLVAKWLRNAKIPHVVANAAPFPGGVDWKTLNAGDVTHVVFVCGPFGNGWPVTEFLSRFEGCPLIGLNLSMLDRIQNWNPFDLLLERDSDVCSRPDMTFLTSPERVPVIGVILAHKQLEYGQRALHDVANAAIDRLLKTREAAIVPIDTRLDAGNHGGLRTPAEIESLIARMDAVVTTRLHGTVLALKSGVPAIAIDPIAGGAKIQRQVEALGWPVWFLAETLNDQELQTALDYCLSQDARQRAAACKAQARLALADLCDQFLEALKPERLSQGVFKTNGDSPSLPEGGLRC